VLAVPRDSLAQQQSKLARIGFLYFGSRQSSLDTGRYTAFMQGMRELGYVEGRNLVIEARFADGKPESLPTLAAELVRLKVDVIVATSTPSYRALQHATTTIPVVITLSFDPVGDGFAASLAQPGGNMTGLAISAADLGPKLLELLKAAAAVRRRVAGVAWARCRAVGKAASSPRARAVVASPRPVRCSGNTTSSWATSCRR